MIFRYRIPPSEQSVLATLLGRRLDSIATDPISAYLTSDEIQFVIDPEESPSFGADSHYGLDVERPTVSVRPAEPYYDDTKVLAHDLGVVRSISIISVLISWSDPIKGEPIQVRPGVVIPEGLDFHWIMYDPRDEQEVERALPPDEFLIDFDIALSLAADVLNGIVLYTDGFRILTSLSGLPKNQRWSQELLHSARLIPHQAPGSTSAA